MTNYENSQIPIYKQIQPNWLGRKTFLKESYLKHQRKQH